MKKIWNNYEIANEDDFGEALKIEYGEWPWGKSVSQTFGQEGARQIAEQLAAMIAEGEPGIPVYQGHPDVPELASHYPDKGAIGWIKKIDVEEDCMLLHVEWDRFPGKGFGWMSPYWGGTVEPDGKGGKKVTVEELYSLGLVNNPNIRNFRLPNEEQTEQTKNEVQEMEKLKKICRELGLPEDATFDQMWDALRKCKEQSDQVEAVKVALKECGIEVDAAKLGNEIKRVIEEKDAAAKTALENCKAEVESVKAELANSKKEAEEKKAALANSEAEVAKLKSLKTVSVTMKLENQAKQTESRLALVNEIMVEKKCDFDSAWAEAKAKKPELFA